MCVCVCTLACVCVCVCVQERVPVCALIFAMQFNLLCCLRTLQAFKTMALKKHPDKNKNNPKAGGRRNMCVWGLAHKMQIAMSFETRVPLSTNLFINAGSSPSRAYFQIPMLISTRAHRHARIHICTSQNSHYILTCSC